MHLLSMLHLRQDVYLPIQTAIKLGKTYLMMFSFQHQKQCFTSDMISIYGLSVFLFLLRRKRSSGLLQKQAQLFVADKVGEEEEKDAIPDTSTFVWHRRTLNSCRVEPFDQHINLEFGTNILSESS